MSSIKKGSVIGIIGGGQLGRMTAQAATKLGYKTHIYSPDKDAPAKQVCDEFTTASYEDKKMLEEFAGKVSVVTFEFENIPFETLKFLEGITLVRPNPGTLHISQNRIREKELAQSIGAKTAPYIAISGSDGISSALETMGGKAILKTAEQGYDGKGQHVIKSKKDIPDFGRFPSHGMVLEGFVDFVKEISVIVARDAEGNMVCFPPGENVHKKGILDTTKVPANISDDTATAARGIAEKLASTLDVIGLLAVEFFLLKDGSVLVNEIAPRPHNSGHWTMDGCVTSQFAQLVRAICGMELGPVDLTVNKIKMQNLIGDTINKWKNKQSDDKTRIHIYGKSETRPGRKMGHLNIVSD